MNPTTNKRPTPQKTTRGGRCRLLRRRLFASPRAPKWTLFGRAPIDLDAPWVQAHIALCPRCQRRFTAYGKVQLGLTLLKSEVHGLDLLSKANAATLGVLRHSLRAAPQATQLKSALPRPRLLQRLSMVSHSLIQTAACATILLLSKVGLFSSIGATQRQGERVVRQYYDDRLGKDMTDDVFGET